MKSAINDLKRLVRFSVDPTVYLRQFDTVFLRPIEKGYDALPIGNGDLAAVVWQPGHLTWMLNKCDLSGEASQAARLIIETPVKLADRVGRLESRLSLAKATVTVRYTGGKITNNWRGIGGKPPQPASRDGGVLKISSFIPHDRNVLLIDYYERPKQPHVTTIALERWLQPSWSGKLKIDVQGRFLVVSYAMKNGFRYAVALTFQGLHRAVLSKRGLARVQLAIPASRELRGRLAVAVVTSHETQDPVSAAMALAADTLKRNPVKLRHENGVFWRDFWSRSFVDAGHPYANALYHMALYELGITSRGRQPVQFNGGLNLWNEQARAWADRYTCHNQYSVYLPLYAANHLELAENFLAWIVKSRAVAMEAAREFWKLPGAYYYENMCFHASLEDLRRQIRSCKGLTHIFSSGTRYCLLLWDRYRYTLDERFLREQAYPVIREVAAFYVHYAKLGKDGLYHLEPALSWEEPPLGHDPHPDCAAWRAIFQIAIEAATRLGIDREQVSTWRERLAKAPPYPIQDGVFSVVMRNEGTPEPPEHFQWQVPNVSGVFPYGVIDSNSPPSLRRIAEATFERYRFNTDAGHEYLPLVAARLGRADWWRAAAFQYLQFFQVHDQGLFNYYNIFGNKVEDSANHKQVHPYLEASGIFAASVNEMLLQSHDGVIRVFPAAPSHWQGRFILRAVGSFLVASERRLPGEVSYILLQALGGGQRDCRVQVPWKNGLTLSAAGRRVHCRMAQRIATFAAKPGLIYIMTPKGKRLRDIPLIMLPKRVNHSPARLGMVWYGNREGANSHDARFPLW